MPCHARNAAGKPCRAPAVHGRKFCIRHSVDPTLRKRAREGSRLGGRNRALTTQRVTAPSIEVGDLDLEAASGLRTIVARALERLASLPFDVRVANAIAQLVNVARPVIDWELANGSAGRPFIAVPVYLPRRLEP
jgi:hypothetical protein